MTHRNAYCDRLDLPVPRLEDVALRKDIKPFHLMILALLAHGAPLELDAIVDFLLAAGIAPERANPYTLKKAWHGLSPVYRAPDGRFGLELDSPEWRWIALTLELRPRTAEPVPSFDIERPGDEVPLSSEEVSAAFRDRNLFAFSALRQAAAVLDARGGGPLSPCQIEAELRAVTQHVATIEQRTIQVWRGDLVRLEAAGNLALNRAASGLGAMRRAIRDLALPELKRQAEAAYWRERSRARDAELAERRRDEQKQAERIRRAIVHVAPDAAAPQAVLVLDLNERRFAAFRSSELSSLPAHLSRYEVLVGLNIRSTLLALGLDPDSWRLSDLKPPQKSLRINRSGRTLALTPEMLISSTTGISKPLGAPARLSEYLARGEWGKLTRRMEADAKALHAYYRYGVLHGYVRLRWGFLDELFGIDWPLPGDRKLRDLLEAAQEAGAQVELVIGSAPGWQDPWAQGRRGHVEGHSGRGVEIRSAERWEAIPLEDIQEIRLILPDGASDAPPESLNTGESR